MRMVDNPPLRTLDALMDELRWEGEVVCVTGGRDYADCIFLYMVLTSMHAQNRIRCLTNGAYRGADALSKQWAKLHGIPYLPFPADWATYSGRAGPLRNAQMIREAQPDVVVAFPGDTGTGNTVMLARTNVPAIRVIDLRKCAVGPYSS
jgi:YspA, cpYpsA-related SLOG family